MRKLLGALLIVLGAFLGGREAAAKKREGYRTLAALADALERMEEELSFRLLPLPELLRTAGEGAAGEVGRFLLRCAEASRMPPDEPFRIRWERELLILGPIGEEGVRALRELGAVLGRCDAQGQADALRRARAALEREAQRQREDAQGSARVVQTLWTAGGALLALLLL